MKCVEVSGRNYDEALEQALKDLNASKDEVEIEVVEEGSKGLFNLFGNKKTVLKVTTKPNSIDNGVEFLSNVLKTMKIEAKVEVVEEDDSAVFNISGEGMGTIIGYRGETLDSLQYLLSLVVNKDHNIPYKRVTLDTENYRSKREETLKHLAEKTAEKVLNSGRAFKLEPMNPYERRIIHSALQGRNDVYTYSDGEEPRRRIVVDIKNKQ